MGPRRPTPLAARCVSVLSNRAIAQRFTMGRLIDVVTGKRNGSVVLGKRQDRNVVTGRPTLALRTLLAARSFLAGLAENAGTRLVALQHCHAAAVTLGATRTMESKGSARRCAGRGGRVGQGIRSAEAESKRLTLDLHSAGLACGPWGRPPA